MSAAGSQILGGTRASSGCRFPRTIPLARHRGTADRGVGQAAGGGRPPAGLKPVADQIRRMPPFGSPKR